MNALTRGRKNFRVRVGPLDPPLEGAYLLKDLPKGTTVLSRLSFHGGYEEACKTLGTLVRGCLVAVGGFTRGN